MNPFVNKRKRLDAMRTLQNKARENSVTVREAAVPDNLFVACPECGHMVPRAALAANLQVCPECGNHMSMTASQRLSSVFDEGRYFRLNDALVGDDPLDFPGYERKLEGLRESTGLSEGVVCAVGCIDGRRVVVCVMDRRFLMGSMGEAVGERITRAFEYATKRGLPLVLFCASGGARMQEGLISLMQMAKASGAVQRHHRAGLLYIAVLTNPTTGGVTASFANLGDITLAEPGALIGFAGPRVIEQTINQKLPEGFQRSEALLECGFLDAIVPRAEMRITLSRLVALHSCSSGRMWNSESGPGEQLGLDAQAGMGEAHDVCLGQPVSLTAMDRVRIARDPKRTGVREYIDALFDDFIELKGDRLCREDASIVGGIATFHGVPITVLGHCKGHDLESNLACNFGMPGPEGYRKVQRLAREAQHFGRPVVNLIDTPGAYPGVEAEERGQGEAIASCLALFSELEVPVLSVVCGEGGSGGALALGVANRVAMLENATYSVLSPEGFAAILWKDGTRVEEACEVMRLTSRDCLELGVVDEVIHEPESGVQNDKDAVVARLDGFLQRSLEAMAAFGGRELAQMRYDRFRAYGTCTDMDGGLSS